jgi:uncharacterized surface anchored protein
VLIEGGTNKTVTFYDPLRPSLTILKKDKITGEVLGGATFRISWNNGANYRDVTTNIDGRAIITDLDDGWYSIVETRAPDGYLLDSTPQQVEFEGGTSKTLTFFDYQKPSLTLVKKDKDTGEILTGATFRVSWNDGVDYRDVTIGEDGRIVITDLDAGWYSIVETKAPNGYLLDPTPQLVELQPGSHKTVEIFDYKKPSLIIVKKDKVTGELLTGATFRVSWNDGADFVDVTIGEDGRAVIPEMDDGWYSIVETKAPDGYILDSTPLLIEVAGGDDKIVEVFDYQKPSLTIIKKDKITGEVLGGATFRISWNNGADYRDGTTDENGRVVFNDLNAGWYTVVETKAPEGYLLDSTPSEILLEGGSHRTIDMFNEAKPTLEITKVDNVTKTPLQYAKFKIELKNEGSTTFIGEYVSDANGVIRLVDILPGRYLVTELQAPDGYNIDNATYEVTIEYGRIYKLEVTNTPKSPIYIQKVDDKGAPLIGAKFKVTTMNGAMVGTVTSSRTGYAIIPYAEPGWYVVEEIQAPDGYILSSTPVNVELKSGRPAQVEFVNFEKPSLDILKLDADSKEPLPGARIKVAKASGEAVGDYTTDTNGLVRLEGLEEGAYVITELRAPEGYILDSTPRPIDLKPGETTALEIYNSMKPGLRILKLDAMTKETLAGATFKVTTANGNSVGEFTTDINGVIQIEGLDAGAYIVTEMRAPDGYILDSTPYPVNLEPGKTASIDIYNAAKPGLRILKMDADTKEILAGATFKIAKPTGETAGEFTTDITGVIHIHDLDAGAYVITELRAPKGYLLDGTPHSVELEPGKTTTVDLYNTAKPGLRILKLDADSRQPLIGAKFKVTTVSGEMVGEFTTDINGLINIEELAVDAYVITELRAPEGYILDVTPYTVSLEAGKTIAVEIYNTAKPGLMLIKKDVLTGLPVAGARFNVTFIENGSKKDLGSFTTSENGAFFIPGLVPGYYIVTETKAADGYLLDSTPREVYVEGGKMNTIEVFNTPYSDLRLLKIDAESREPLEGAIFKLFDEKRLEVGTYTTTARGEIFITGIPSGNYFIQEVKAPAGYVLDNTVRQVELLGGKTTTVEIKNTALGTLRILKIDAETKKPLYGATFLLYDNKDNLLGEFSTDQNGVIVFGKSLQAGTYKLKEIKAPEGYLLDETIHTITVKAGSTLEYTVKNELQVGRIQIVKVSDSDNELTGDDAGDGLKGAVFEIFDDELSLVDKIKTDSNGLATSKDLPLGKYVIKEVEAPQYYFTDGEPFYAEIKVHDDLIRFKIENTPEIVEVDITKRGVAETMPGEAIRYTFSDMANLSNCELEEFYWRDELPTDAVRIMSLNTGTWSARATYEVWIKTNLKDWKRIKSNLHTNTEYTINMTPQALGLSGIEYITEFKLVFDKVPAGFSAEKDPFIEVRVNASLPNSYRFVNNSDIGGRRGEEWVYDRDSWTTVIYNPFGIDGKPRKLPKTGGADFFTLHPEYLPYLDE